MDDLLVATVLKPQGIRGELKVKTYTDDASDFESFAFVQIDGVAYKVLKVRPSGEDCAFLTLRGIADRNTAELLRGKEIYVRREDIPELPQDTWFIVDLLGATVQSEEGDVYGVLTDVTPAASDIFTLEKDKKTYMFVNVEGVLQSVDTEAKVITVNKKRFLEVVVEQ